MSRTAISGSPDLVSGRSTVGGSKADSKKEVVSTITTNINLRSSTFSNSSKDEGKR